MELLRDLHDLADRAGTQKAVAKRIQELRERHRGKRTLIQRLDRAILLHKLPDTDVP